MTFLRNFFVLLGIVVSFPIVAYSGFAIHALSFSSYTSGLLAVFPWFFGACGVAGLLRSVAPPATKSALRLRTDSLLLVLGVIGSLIATTLWLSFFPPLDPGSSDAGAWLRVALILTVFPVLPVTVAVIEIHRATVLWHSNPLPDKSRFRRFILMLVIGPVLIGGGRVLAQEGVMVWYGRDLVTAAYTSAEKLSGGEPYCVLDYDGADTFEKLDRRRILLDATQQRLDWSRPFTARPHFGIAVDNKVYWWSFREREFLWYRPGVWFQHPPTTCAGDPAAM